MPSKKPKQRQGVTPARRTSSMENLISTTLNYEKQRYLRNQPYLINAPTTVFSRTAKNQLPSKRKQILVAQTIAKNIKTGNKSLLNNNSGLLHHMERESVLRCKQGKAARRSNYFKSKRSGGAKRISLPRKHKC